MKVDQTNAEFVDFNKRLDAKIRSQTTKKEAEIENLKKLYDKKIENAKIEGEDRFVGTIKRNDDLLEVAAKDYEQKLNDYKDHLEKTEAAVAKNELIIRNNHNEKIENQKIQFQNEISDQYQSAHDNQNALLDQNHSRMQAITDKALTERNHLEIEAKNQLNHLSGQYNQKALTNERQYRAELENNIRNQQENIVLQKNELNKAMDKITEKNKRLENDKIRVQTEELNYLDRHQKDVLAQKQSDFQVRYENMVKEHESLLSKLKDHFEADVKKLALSNVEKKRVIASKGDDKFYRVETLNPKISENEKEYFVSLSIPEHEKENVHLSVHGREVKMTMTRKYTDTVEDSDGSLNRSTRNELFSKEFSSTDLLNPKQVVQKYQDGILTFKILKL